MLDDSKVEGKQWWDTSSSPDVFYASTTNETKNKFWMWVIILTIALAALGVSLYFGFTSLSSSSAAGSTSSIPVGHYDFVSNYSLSKLDPTGSSSLVYLIPQMVNGNVQLALSYDSTASVWTYNATQNTLSTTLAADGSTWVLVLVNSNTVFQLVSAATYQNSTYSADIALRIDNTIYCISQNMCANFVDLASGTMSAITCQGNANTDSTQGYAGKWADAWTATSLT